MRVWDNVKHDFKTDVTWNRVARLGAQGARALPSASAHYALDKLPIIGWLPRYNYRWLLNDLIAGLTLGLMLIPQGLSYAKLALIPVQYGLLSSWLPAAIYAFMGSTKDVSTGPTSLIGLLTSQAVTALPEYSPSDVASAVAMMMGVYGMVLGFLKLGFLLEFISLPILNGFISAVAITIGLNQVSSLLGEKGVSGSTANQIHRIFQHLPTCNGIACAVGFSGIIFMVVLDQAGKRWASKNRIIWFLSITRAFLCLVLFTGISYAVNKNRGSSKHFLFDVVELKSEGLGHPQMPKQALLGKVASRSIAVFIGGAVEHTAIARAFGFRNNYITDQSQELTYLGVTNFFNSFFHAMGVGGAMSRTAVNSACNVKSPLSGFVTTATILVCIYKLSGALYWIPKATLAAIIITAVWPLISSPVVFYRFWKVSLGDFISSMIAFWVSLFYTTEIGIFASVGFNIVYCLARQVFTNISAVGADPRSELAAALDAARGMPPSIPADTRIFRFNESFFFPNSYRLKTEMLDSVQTHHAPAYSTLYGAEADRNWSVVREKHVARLRKKAHVEDPSTLPPVRLVVLDFGRVNHTDYTAATHLRALFAELKKYAGKNLEIRFVGMSEYVRQRYGREGWSIVDAENYDGTQEKAVMLYRTVAAAVAAPRRQTEDDADIVDVVKGDDEENVMVSHNEKV